jgi:hypothetical protein
MKQTDEPKMTNAEKMVANYLEEEGYTLLYQPKVSIVDEGERDRLWYPDFLIKKLGLYVEVCGADRHKDYQRRMEIYKKNKITKVLKTMRWELVVIYGLITMIFIALFYSTEIWFGRGVIPIYGFLSVLLLFIYMNRWTKLEQEI